MSVGYHIAQGSRRFWLWSFFLGSRSPSQKWLVLQFFPFPWGLSCHKLSLLVKWVILKVFDINILVWKKALGEGMTEGSRNRMWEPWVPLRVIVGGWVGGGWWGRPEWRDCSIKDELPPTFQSCKANNNQDTNCINIILFPDHSSLFSF